MLTLFKLDFRRGGAKRHESLLDMLSHRRCSFVDAFVDGDGASTNENGLRRSSMPVGDSDNDASSAEWWLVVAMTTESSREIRSDDSLCPPSSDESKIDVSDCGLSTTIETSEGCTPCSSKRELKKAGRSRPISIYTQRTTTPADGGAWSTMCIGEIFVVRVVVMMMMAMPGVF